MSRTRKQQPDMAEQLSRYLASVPKVKSRCYLCSHPDQAMVRLIEQKWIAREMRFGQVVGFLDHLGFYEPNMRNRVRCHFEGRHHLLEKP